MNADAYLGESALSSARRAARNQGLDIIEAHLIEAGVRVDLENTGGHCMALTTLVYDFGAEDFRDFVQVVVVAGEGEGTYYVTRMPLSVWVGHPSEDRETHDFDPGGAEVYGVEAALARHEMLRRGES